MVPSPTIDIVHFHNGTGGGVLSVIRNLLNYRQHEYIKNHVIYTINKDLYPEFDIPTLAGVASVQVFYFSPKWNFYYTCRRLSSFLPDNKAVIVAHDWLELAMVSNLGLKNPVVHILHGDFDYYYELAQKNKNVIDAFICISHVIFKKMNQTLEDNTDDIFYLNFPVPIVEAKKNINSVVNLIYYVRDLNDERKQFKVILEIAKALAKDKQHYFFTVAGGGLSKEEFYKVWPESMVDRVSFLGSIINHKLLLLLPSQDIFLLPSLSEGLPVSLVESMKAGVVPLVTNWDGAVADLVINNISGFYLSIGDVEGYVKIIQRLANDKNELKMLSLNCSLKANLLFDPSENTRNIESVFIKTNEKVNQIKKPKKVYGSRLDQKWIPNSFVFIIRNFLKRI